MFLMVLDTMKILRMVIMANRCLKGRVEICK